MDIILKNILYIIISVTITFLLNKVFGIDTNVYLVGLIYLVLIGREVSSGKNDYILVDLGIIKKGDKDE